MTPFDFINAISYSKEDMFKDPQAEKDYAPFIVNRGLSYFSDSIFFANEMNKYNTIPKQWQFEFLKNSIPKRKRFSKWAKKTPVTDKVTLIQDVYKYSTEKAIDAASILSEEHFEYLKQQMDKGGTS